MFKEWIASFFAINEKRLSTIVVLTLFFSVIAAWQIVKLKIPMDENLRIIVVNGLYLIGGVTITDTVATTANKIWGGKKEE